MLKTKSMSLVGRRQRATKISTWSSGSDSFPNFLMTCVPVKSAGIGVAVAVVVGGSADGIWTLSIRELLAELSCARESKWNLLSHQNESNPFLIECLSSSDIPDGFIETFVCSLVSGQLQNLQDHTDVAIVPQEHFLVVWNLSKVASMLFRLEIDLSL